jgi:serine/threonine protein kinase
MKTVRTEDEEIRGEIQREYEVLKVLNHPNLIRGVEIFDVDNQISIVMDKVDGENLNTFFTEES